MRYARIAATVLLLVACGGPAASPTAIPATPAPTPTSLPSSGAIPVPSNPAGTGTLGPFNGTGVHVGVYFINEGGLRYTFTVPASGWWTNNYPDFLAIGKVHGDNGPMTRLFILDDDGGDVFTDACHWKTTELVPGPTVDDLVAALAAVNGFESSGLSDATVGGYSAKHVRLTVPADANMATCDEGTYQGLHAFSDIQAGQVEDFWVFDADGTRHVVWSPFDGNTPADAQAELTQLINSLQIEPATP